MVDSLNHAILPALPDRQDPPVVVECATCHRGSPLPQTLDMVLRAVIDRYGVDSAVARYKTLRQDMVSGRYDFSEWSINELARTLSATGKVNEGIAMLKMNQQYYPDSPDIDYMLGEDYMKLGDKDQAIQSYRAVLSKRPDDQRAKRRLNELGAGSASG
jgi:tetratricopeptide (TPR) repeat protein